jgi:hypothetical protein
MTAACPPAVAQPDPDQLHLRVEAELVRTAFRDAIYGAPFGIVVALLYAFAIHTAFPVPTVLGWLAFALTANLARLASRWAYFRQPVPGNGTDRWRL